jgi:EF hand
MRLAILTVIVLISAASGAQAVNNPGLSKPGSGMNGAKCEAAWTAVSPNGATISKDELAPSIADVDFTVLDLNNDGTVDADEFMAGCKGGLIKIAH